LTSYCWVMMGLHFLQTRNPPVLPCLHEMYFKRLSTDPSQTCRIVIDGVDCSFYEDTDALQGFGDSNKESLGDLLYGFFRHYALDFDYNSHVVSVRHGRFLEKREKGWDQDVQRLCRFLCVEEPFNPQRNLANSADLLAVLGLRDEFRRAVDILSATGDVGAVFERYSTSALKMQYVSSANRGPSNGISLGHSRSASASSTPFSSQHHPPYHSSTANLYSGNHVSTGLKNGAVYPPSSRTTVRSFGTGMYPTQHKQQQTEAPPAYWTHVQQQYTGSHQPFYSEPLSSSQQQPATHPYASHMGGMKKGFYPGYYYGYPLPSSTSSSSAPVFKEEEEDKEQDEVSSSQDEFTGTRATQTGHDGDVETHFPALGKSQTLVPSQPTPVMDRISSQDSDAVVGLGKTPAPAPTVWAAIDTKAYPKPCIPDSLKSGLTPGPTTSTGVAPVKQKKGGQKQQRQSQAEKNGPPPDLQKEQTRQQTRRSTQHSHSHRKGPSFVNLPVNGLHVSLEMEGKNAASSSGAPSAEQKHRPRRVDSAKSVDDLSLPSTNVDPSMGALQDSSLAIKKKGSKGMLVWSNHSHRHGRTSSSAGSLANGHANETSPQKMMMDNTNATLKMIGSFESLSLKPISAEVSQMANGSENHHYRSRSLSAGRDLTR
jgi:hypothetical protein